MASRPGSRSRTASPPYTKNENLVEIVSAREDGCAFRVDRSEHKLSVRVP